MIETKSASLVWANGYEQESLLINGISVATYDFIPYTICQKYSTSPKSNTKSRFWNYLGVRRAGTVELALLVNWFRGYKECLFTS